MSRFRVATMSTAVVERRFPRVVAPSTPISLQVPAHPYASRSAVYLPSTRPERTHNLRSTTGEMESGGSFAFGPSQGGSSGRSQLAQGYSNLNSPLSALNLYSSIYSFPK